MTTRTRVKICGLRSESDVTAAVDAGADAVGFVFVESSPRYIAPESAAELVCLLPPLVRPVGLFADQRATDICAMAMDACIELVQLHGREDRRCVELVREEFAVIKAVQFGDPEWQLWADFDAIDLLLVDGSSGGQGRAFDWTALAAQRDSVNAPLVLAGGLTPENVGEAINLVHPFAVDVSSGVERERGAKDERLIRQFCLAVAEADRRSAP